jgi:hypothetical protein
MKEHPAHRHAARLQKTDDESFVILVRYVEMHFLERDEDLDEAGDVFDRLVVFTGKRNAFRARPGDPGASMRMPLGWK